MRVRDLLELVRAPAVLTVFGDGVVGATAADGRIGAEGAAASAASAGFYAAGMALNDFADAELDAIERPERPIPSGRVSPGAALTTAAGLSAGGLASAAAAGPGALRVARPLVACVWFYDLVAKKTALGPAAMAACRGLDVAMGAAADGWRGAAAPAAAIAGHTFAVTQVSRGEVHGTSRPVAVLAAVVSTAAAATAVVRAVRLGRPRGAAGAVIGAGAFVCSVLPGFLRAAREPTAGNARDATRRGIRGMVPLQAAFAAGHGSTRGALLLAGLAALGRIVAARKKQGDVT
ncbi:SCO3242 family prenyltransferase [Microbacterium halophytorum]|uniref:SCO3242 family prenyltransferase n=1 Tax=Microbacterium halophytorum TaxID=2067568 RepID=UPI000CFB5228|nr:UbiA family prenyltransferase [Microbacterium halophytorum]